VCIVFITKDTFVLTLLYVGMCNVLCHLALWSCAGSRVVRIDLLHFLADVILGD